MSFMESPFVLRSIEEIEFLQDRVKEIAIIADVSKNYGKEDRTEELHLEFLHCLYALAEKEHNLYTRISLSDDPDAQDYKTELEEQALDFGVSKTSGLNNYYLELKENVKDKIREISGEDLDDYDGIDIVFNWTDGTDG